MWSRQQEVQRTFGKTVSIADFVSQVSSEEAMRECHEQSANFDANLLGHVFCVFKTHYVTSFVIDRDSRNNIIPPWSRG